MKGKISNSKGVFASLTGDDGGKNLYNKFIADTAKTKVETPELQSFLTLYKSRITKVEPELQRLSKIEEILLQIRAIETVKDIKLSLVREYVYARTSFYRHDKKVKDVRVVVGKVDEYPQELDVLHKSRKFMKLAKEKLIEVMKQDIENNIKDFKKNYK